MTATARTALPHVEAQLATLVKAPPEGPGWLYELKYDGYRALAYKRGSSVTLVSRRGNHFAAFDSVELAVSKLHCTDAIFDGEVCALDERGRPSFEGLQTRTSALVYFVFDVLFLDGVDLRSLPLSDRKAALARVIRPTDRGIVRRVVATDGSGAAFLDAVRSLELEGLVAKRADRPWRAGRSLEWQKVKVDVRQELVVIGFTRPSGTRLGLGALLLGVYEGKTLRYAGKVGTGMDEAMLHTLTAKLSRLELGATPAIGVPKMHGARWVRPELVVEVRFGEWTRDGRLRHPVFVGLRPDKRATDVVRERPINS